MPHRHLASDARTAGRKGIAVWIVAAALLLSTASGAGAQPGSRRVHLELFPTRDAKPLAIVVRENETLIRSIKELGTLAFEVRFRDRQEKAVLVVVFDAETRPHVLLGATEVPLDGKRIDANASPTFGLRVRRVDAGR